MIAMRVFLNVHINQLRSALEEILCRRFGGMTRGNCGPATFNLFLKPRNACFQLVRGKRGNILAQLNVGQFLGAGQKIVAIHQRSHWRYDLLALV